MVAKRPVVVGMTGRAVGDDGAVRDREGLRRPGNLPAREILAVEETGEAGLESRRLSLDHSGRGEHHEEHAFHGRESIIGTRQPTASSFQFPASSFQNVVTSVLASAKPRARERQAPDSCQLPAFSFQNVVTSVLASAKAHSPTASGPKPKPKARQRKAPLESDRVLTRFAPAPTGWLHLGHVLNADLVWRLARERARTCTAPHRGPRPRAMPARVRGRHPGRSRLARLRAGDLSDGRVSRRAAATGANPIATSSIGRRRTSLRAQGLVYGCDCTRREIASRLAHRSAGAPLQRPCRDRGLRSTDGVGWRVRMDPGRRAFVDERLGPQAQDPVAQCGDVLIRDRHGNWTYQFASRSTTSIRASIS